MSQSPYLKEQRLADVIAAITTLGIYKFYKLDIPTWADRISGSKEKADHWRDVFSEHPEFFRLTAEQKKVSLVWRRQHPRNFNVDAEPELLPDHEIDGTTENRISRRPLASEEITALIGVAVKLHDRALEQQKARGWWVPLAVGAVSFMGALLGALIAGR